MALRLFNNDKKLNQLQTIISTSCVQNSNIDMIFIKKHHLYTHVYYGSLTFNNLHVTLSCCGRTQTYIASISFVT